jgi:hypothetical protein
MFRLGLAELREAFSPGGNIAQPTPLGMYGTLTPGEVGSARDTDPNVRQLEEEPLMNDNQRLPSPSEIADGKTAAAMHGGQQQAGKVHGETAQAKAEGGVQGPEHGVYGPEHGVYGPEKGVYGRDNGVHGPQAADGAKPGPLPPPGDIADGKVAQEGQGQGNALGQEAGKAKPGGYVERLLNERQGNQGGDAGADQNDQARGRSLPQEQHDRGRGRGR